MTDPIILQGQNPVIEVQPGQKITGIPTAGRRVTGGTSKTQKTASMTSTGTWVIPDPDTDPPPVDPPPPPPPPPTGTWGPLRAIPTPTVTAPPVGGSYVDPVTGKTVRHVSALRQDYATRPLWNADGSLAMVRTPQKPPGQMIVDPCRLLDGHTFADKGQFPLYSSGLWSSVDPDKAYGIDTSANFLIYNRVSNRAAVRLAAVPSGSAIGAGEGALSDDDSLIAVVGGGRVLTFDARTGKALGSMTWGGDNVKPSHSGKYVVLVGGNVIVTNADLTGARVLWPSGNHGDCVTIDGEDWFVMNNANGVRAFRLRDGAQRQLLPAGTAFEYGHVSGRDPDRIVLSNHNTPATRGRLGCDQIVDVAKDGSGLVLVLGFPHHGGESPYNSQPHATAGHGAVAWASEWGGSIGLWVA